MAMVISRFDILLVSLDPSQGFEIKKTRPCVVISPDEMNKYLKTIIVAPITSTLKDYPTRINISFDNKEGNIVLDQLRTIEKSRILQMLGVLDAKTTLLLLETLRKMFLK